MSERYYTAYSALLNCFINDSAFDFPEPGEPSSINDGKFKAKVIELCREVAENSRESGTFQQGDGLLILQAEYSPDLAHWLMSVAGVFQADGKPDEAQMFEYLAAITRFGGIYFPGEPDLLKELGFSDEIVKACGEYQDTGNIQAAFARVRKVKRGGSIPERAVFVKIVKRKIPDFRYPKARAASGRRRSDNQS